MVGPNFNVNSSKVTAPGNKIVVSTSKQLINALNQVKPGQTITLKNGQYLLKGKRFLTGERNASETLPITLMAENAGRVDLQLDSVEGLYINQPYWTISGLRFIGICKDDNKCEHAIHVVGKAKNLLISNNEFIDFNAAIKVNALHQNFPDNGIIKYNHFFSTKPRNTSRSVTPINIDHANNWTVSRNIIRDFIKTEGNKVSYGAFIKGGAVNGFFENNLIICNSSTKKYLGASVGLSVGGGGMTNRRNNAFYEANKIIIRNNIVLHCSDVGVYVNRGKDTIINNNILYNTNGIDIRFPESTATVVNNLFSGKLRPRDNGTIERNDGNLIFPRSFINNDEKLNNIFESPEIGNFKFIKDRLDINDDAVNYPSIDDNNHSDFCGHTIKKNTKYIGAFSDANGCFPISPQ